MSLGGGVKIPGAIVDKTVTRGNCEAAKDEVAIPVDFKLAGAEEFGPFRNCQA